MKKLLFLPIALLAAIPAFGQAWSGRSTGDARVTPPYRLCVGEDNGLDVCMQQTAANIEKITNGSLDFALVSKTVATLPSAASNTSRVYRVTDGASTADCTTGLGTNSVVCVSNGSIWVPLGGGGVQNVGSAPSGACTPGATPQLVTSTGILYTCQSSTWGPVPGIQNVSSAPAGACTPGAIPQQVISTGVLYTCQSSVWTSVTASSAAQNPMNNSGLSANFPWNILGDTHFQGPNPSGVDLTVSPYYARAVGFNGTPTTTGTISASSTSLSMTSASNFQQNDGLAILSAGATNCATQPSALSAAPSLASSATNTGNAVAGGTGSTSVSYTWIAISKGGCYTAAAPVFTVSNSNNSMGPNQLAIISQSIANGGGAVPGEGLMTVTVSSTSGFPSNFWARISGTTGVTTGTPDDPEAGGYKHLAVLDGTHFTYYTSWNPLYGMNNISWTGGTIYYWAENLITLPSLPAGTNMYKAVIYRCTTTCSLPTNAANYSPIIVTYPLNLGYGPNDQTYGLFDDYGTTMSPALTTYDWFIPATPPSSNINDMLVTTISSLAGNTATLANAATNTVTNTSCNGGTCALQLDTVPAISAADTAKKCGTSGCNGTPRFPVPIVGSGSSLLCYPISSFYEFTGAYIQDGAICPYTTMYWHNATWEGTILNSQQLIAPSFNMQYLPPIYGQNAIPAIWRNASSIRRVSINSAVNGIGTFDNSNVPTITQDVSFQTINQPSTDYNGIPYWYSLSNTGTGEFGGHFTNTAWNTGPGGLVPATTNTPLFVSKNGQEFVFDYMVGSRRGFYFECNNGNTGCTPHDRFVVGEEWQGHITPFLSFNNNINGNVGGNIDLEFMYEDTSSEPFVVNSSVLGGVGASLEISGINATGGLPVVTGNPFYGTTFVHNYSGTTTASLGNNTSLIICGINNQVVAGCKMPSVQQNFGNYSGNHTLNALEGGVVMTSTATVTAPHALNGFSWSVFDQSGTTTITIDSGTLYGNGTTGNITLIAGQGAQVWCNGINCYVLGLGSSSSGGPALQTNGTNNASQSALNQINSTTNSIGATFSVTNTTGGTVKGEVAGLINATGGGTGVSNPTAHTVPVAEGSSPYNFICNNALTGQVIAAINGADPACSSLGIAGRTVSSGTDNILCDSGTTLQDRGHTIEYTANSTVTLPDAGSSGCANNFYFAVMIGGTGVSVTINRTTSSTFTVYNGTSASTGATSLTLSSGQYATFTSRDNANWVARVTQTANLGKPTTLDLTNATNFPLSGLGTITTGGIPLALASGTGTAGQLACEVSSNTMGNCTGTPPNTFLGIFLSGGTAYTNLGIVSVALDTTQNVTAGDILCASTVAGYSHDNGATSCASGQYVGQVTTTASGVSSVTANVRLQ